MDKNLNIMYFSPTNTTKKIVYGIANTILKNMNIISITKDINFTLPKVRQESVSFMENDIVIVGIPVYAGRVPNILLKYLNLIKGNGAIAIPIVLYGNRNYDDALLELKDILELDGFKIMAAATFIGEHSFSKILAKNRPDEKDMLIVSDFANQICTKLLIKDKIEPLIIKGNNPYRKYYMPKDKNNNPVDIRKVTPKTNSNCINCKLCVSVCPMGSIGIEDVSSLNGICIKCGACIKKCPTKAKYYDDVNYLKHKNELEIDFAYRKEPELFI